MKPSFLSAAVFPGFWGLLFLFFLGFSLGFGAKCLEILGKLAEASHEFRPIARQTSPRPRHEGPPMAAAPRSRGQRQPGLGRRFAAGIGWWWWWLMRSKRRKRSNRRRTRRRSNRKEHEHEEEAVP